MKREKWLYRNGIFYLRRKNIMCNLKNWKRRKLTQTEMARSENPYCISTVVISDPECSSWALPVMVRGISQKGNSAEHLCNTCSLWQGNHKAAPKRSYLKKPAVLWNVFIPSSLCCISLPARYFGRSPLEMLCGTKEEIAQPVVEL